MGRRWLQLDWNEAMRFTLDTVIQRVGFDSSLQGQLSFFFFPSILLGRVPETLSTVQSYPSFRLSDQTPLLLRVV